MSDMESVTSHSHDSDSDYEDLPPVKVKVPLNAQFKKAAPHEMTTDIDWVPSLEKYLQRAAQHLEAGLPTVSLPSELPVSAQGGPCWTGKDIVVDDLVTRLDDEHIQEIELAVCHFKNLDLSKNDISRETFPLPKVGEILNGISNDVHSGLGVAVLRGLQPSKYSFDDNIITYAGIAAHVGEVRGKQDNAGNILVHIKDVGSRVAADDLRQSPYANNAQPFHNDLGEIIALYCIDKAMTGGVSKVAPTATVYNELAACRPDLIREMIAPDWAFDKNDGSQTYRSRPILFYDNNTDRAFFCFSRRQLTGSKVSPKPSYLPQLTEAQAEALDAVHFTAEKHALSIQLERGDIQFSNNLAIFHAREAFQDGIDSSKRHLVRMWLKNERHGWSIPHDLREIWCEIYGDQRKPTWHMSPNHERAHVINRYESCHG